MDEMDKAMLDTILFLLVNKRAKEQELCSYLGLQKSTMTKWKTGQNKSYKKRIKEISEFFDMKEADFYEILYAQDQASALNDVKVRKRLGLTDAQIKENMRRAKEREENTAIVILPNGERRRIDMRKLLKVMEEEDNETH